MSESGDLVGILYMDVLSAYSLSQMLEKDLKVCSETLEMSFPELFEKLREQIEKDQNQSEEPE